MEIKVDKNLPTPAYWQIANQIKEMILTGTLLPGAVLPSERLLAEMSKVHRNTVIKAYGMLEDDQLIEAKQGLGYYVSYGLPEDKALTRKAAARSKVNWNYLIKDKYQDAEKTFDDIFQRFTKSNTISLSTGMVPAVYDEKEIAEAISFILEGEGEMPSLLSSYQGDISLRKQIVLFLRKKGVNARPGEIQIMSEANQALDFIATAILEEGDKVIMEEPVSPDVYRVVKLAGGIPITVPVDENGMICDHLEMLIEKHKPKFIYVNSSYQDPTGAVLSLERRKKIIELSNKYRLPIVEDDQATDITFDGKELPSLKSMDLNGNVVYIHTFSLTFIPGISLAFILAPAKLSKILGYIVSIRMMNLDSLKQKLLALYMERGVFEKRMEEIKKIVKDKCDLVCSIIDEEKILNISYVKPKGGVYLWCSLPPGVDGKKLTALALKQGVSIIPGEVFYPLRNGGQNYIRLCYAYETRDRIEKGMNILLGLIKELAQ